MRNTASEGISDHEGRQIILTDVAEQHILSGHPEIVAVGSHRVIGETLAAPDIVVSSNRALQYFRMYPDTPFGGKYVRVVVTEDGGVKYVRTAFITGRVVKGDTIWERQT